MSGTLHGDDRLVNSATSTEERLHGLFHLRGKDHLTVNQIVAGDIGGIAKLAATPSHSTLAAKGSPVRVEPPAAPSPNYQLALEPVTQSDDDKLSDSLSRLVSEDPTLRVVRSEETHQTVLCGAGDTHVAVALERLARKFGVNVTTADVKVPYRETISANADSEGKVKKQSGGHGQYAVVNMRVQPTERGTGTEFVDKIVGGAIPRNFLPAVQKGVEETMATGGAFGFPVVDVKVECYDGKYHSVDSSDMAFRTAASLGLKEALAKASPVVLEPVSLGHGERARVDARRRARRHQLTAWPGQRLQPAGRRTHRDHGTRAGGRDPALRRRPALDDRWSRLVRGRSRPLRRAPPAPHEQAGRRTRSKAS